MTEQLRETYFLVIRTCLLLALEIYIVFSQAAFIGVSGGEILLLAFFVGSMSGKELVRRRISRWALTGISAVFCLIMVMVWGKEFLLLGILLGYEVITMIKPPVFWYCLPFAMAFVPGKTGTAVQVMLTLLMCMLYIQHDFIVASYREQTKEDILSEQRLKRDMCEQEYALREEMDKSLLKAENQLLEERARLSQLLHDKLGHTINGSVYQLEAVKLIMEEEPETARNMIGAVIGQLRTGMDEIRAILRKERPRKYKLALLQLQQLCEDCSQKGVEAQLHIKGEPAEIPEKYLEIILDNAFEAVSNSLKYAKCTKIDIMIHVLNQMVCCRISDNGIGCTAIEDGMGIAGMRRRVREVNGILDFETEMGFTINILLPR